MRYFQQINISILLLLAMLTFMPTNVDADYEQNKRLAQDLMDISKYGVVRDRSSVDLGSTIITLFIVSIIVYGIWKIGYVILMLVALLVFTISDKRKSRLRIIRWGNEKHKVKARYIRVVKKGVNDQEKVIRSLATKFSVSHDVIISYLKSEGIYKFRKHDSDSKQLNRYKKNGKKYNEVKIIIKKNRDNEAKEIDMILTRYIIGEYKLIENKCDRVRENRIKKMAEETDETIAFVIKILQNNNFNSIPIIN